MAFASGSIALKRFFVIGDSYDRVDEALLKKLSAKAMTADTVRTSDLTELGWVTGEHILDSEFDFAKNALADGLHFALRIDTNKPPTDLVRSYQKINERAMLEAAGKDFLSKAQRREAREQALSQADAEARKGSFRRMKQVPVFWDLKRNEVYLGATGTSIVDRFSLLFTETFACSLTPADSGELASRWAVKVGETQAYDHCHPCFFVNPPEGADSLTDDSDQMERGRNFLGTEWLMWLWYASHVESPEVTTPRGEPITVLFEKSLTMECAFRMNGAMAISAEGPTRLPEAIVALAGGKRPIRAGLQIAVHGDVFSFGVRGDMMHYSSIQLPPPEDAGTPQMVFEDRLDKLRDLIEAADALYIAFLKRRLSSKWPQTLDAIRTWVSSGRHDGLRITGETPPLLEAAS